MTSKKQRAQQGSVFFYILLAIVLLAGLSYAVSRGNRGSTSIMTDQQAKVAAQEIIDYGNTVANAVQKLRLRGCADTELDFYNEIWRNVDTSLVHASGHNPSAPSSGCSIFDSNDGNIAAQTFDESNFITTIGSTPAGTLRVRVMGVPSVGSSEPELLLYLPLVKDEVCLKINDLLGIDNPSNQPPQYTPSTIPDYVGSYTGSGILTDSSGVLTGRTVFCGQKSTAPVNNRFFQVLIAR